MSNTKNKRVRQEDEAPLAKMFTSSLKGGALAMLLSLALALIMTLIANFSKNPDALITPLALIALYLSAFAGGLIATKINGSSSLICGLFSGGIFMLVLMLVSFIIPSTSSEIGFFRSFILHALIIIISILGGYAGQKKTKKTHKPRR